MLTAAEQHSVRAYIDLVSNVYSFLSEQLDLSPRNQKLNAILYGFVQNTMKERSADEVASILSDERIQQIAPRMRRLLARAEYEMERFCALAMVMGETKLEEGFSSYRKFIYRSNYDALVAAELDATGWHPQAQLIGAERGSIAFVGAGPLPISAIMFHQRTGLPVTCIDSDDSACLLGRQLVHYLSENHAEYADLDRAVHFVNVSGDEYDFAMHPIVLIASLVQAKEPIITQILNTARRATTTIIRGAVGLSTLLYQPEDCVSNREKNAYLVGTTRPSPKAINTSFIYRFPCVGMAEATTSVRGRQVDYLNNSASLQTATAYAHPALRHTAGADSG